MPKIVVNAEKEIRALSLIIEVQEQFNQSQTYEGPSKRGIRNYSWNPPTGNRIQNLDLLEQ